MRAVHCPKPPLQALAILTTALPAIDSFCDLNQRKEVEVTRTDVLKMSHLRTDMFGAGVTISNGAGKGGFLHSIVAGNPLAGSKFSPRRVGVTHAKKSTGVKLASPTPVTTKGRATKDRPKCDILNC